MSVGPRRIAVVTGSRAEYGLLQTVLDAIDAHPGLEARLVVAGAHLLPGTGTVQGIRAERSIHAEVPMQSAGREGRHADAEALGRGVQGFAEVFQAMEPDIVLVLGDRIEAFAAAGAASVAGLRVAHMHGGDRAEGLADEAMRHAVTKLAHIHLPATAQSAERIRRMGEPEESIVLVGSPAADHLDDMKPLSEGEFVELGSPRTIFLMHGVGNPEEVERNHAEEVLSACAAEGSVLALEPNADPGSAAIRAVIHAAPSGVTRIQHLERSRFVGALRRVDALVGNSSAGLIEAAIVGCPAVNVGIRQGGRERADNVLDVLEPRATRVRDAIVEARNMPRETSHPYGDGRCGWRVAKVLAEVDLEGVVRKRNAY
ncbi:MAG: UDP-N-acetylglucosamine 2-epimerase [Phycisphaerales bacterium]|nr:UDP-N-acetylglucosamine 2-epimerase [Phycisphaerales bacterium]